MPDDLRMITVEWGGVPDEMTGTLANPETPRVTKGAISRTLYKFGAVEPEIHPSAHLGHFSFFDCRARITIEANVMLGFRVMLLTGTHDYFQTGEARIKEVDGRPIRVCEGAWLASGAIIYPGVTIGAHAVVAAGAVVMRNVPAYAVVAGNPARVMRKIRTEGGEDDAVRKQE